MPPAGLECEQETIFLSMHTAHMVTNPGRPVAPCGHGWVQELWIGP